MKKVWLKKTGLTVLAVVLLLSLAILQQGIFEIQAIQTIDADNAKPGIAVPIIMYHSILKDSQKAGKFVVSPAVLEQDLQYLKDHGYVSIVMSDLIDYVNGEAELPEKPVIITLDDGYYNNVTYLLPVLERFNMKAVISVVGLYTERFSEQPDQNPNYSHLTWDDIIDLTESGYIEIQNHSYNMHNQNDRNGSMRKKGEDAEQYKKVFMEDVMKLQNLLKEKTNILPTTYTYPYGLISPETREYLKEMGFLCTLTCYEKMNYITKDPDCLYGLGRYNRPSGISTQEFMKKALATK